MTTPGQDDGLQVNLPDCLPASSRADSLEQHPTARDIRLPDGAPPDYAALVRRLDRMELHRRALLFVAVVACVASVTCLYLVRQERSAQERPVQEQRAQERPAPGRPAPEPRIAEPGTVLVRRVVFVDGAGNRRDSIRLDESGTGIAFCDSNGVKRALFYTSPEGTTGWNLLNPDGKLRVSIGVLKDGAGHVAVFDDDPKHFVFLLARGMTLYEGQRTRAQFLNVNGLAGISIFDQKGRSRIGMGMNERGPTFVITDEDGKSVFSKP